MQNTFLIQKSRSKDIILSEVFCENLKNDTTKITVLTELGDDIYPIERILFLTNEQINQIEKVTNSKKIKIIK